jgi:transcriptional regulator with XRE-family HTH domain
MTYQGPDEDRDALEALGRAVRFARQQSSLTQRELEALTGVDQTAISRMERGVVPGMGLVRFARIAMVLSGSLLVVDVQRAGRHTTGVQLAIPDINGDADRGSHGEADPGG